MDLLDTWGEGPAAGGLAIFEAPYTYEGQGSLKYWSSVSEVRRYMVQIRPDGDEACEVLIRGDELIISNFDFPVPGGVNTEYETPGTLSKVRLR